jgi:Rrf2 family iron-sulfur cluster assembly transcriptional regulator
MKVSTRVRYGCRAMLDLALHDQGEPVAIDTLAREQQMPERYLAKIIQDLRRSGLIRSVRGAGGGYVLNAAPEQITLGAVWDALEGPFVPVECLRTNAACSMSEECVTREVWAELEQRVRALLDSVTVKDLVRRHHSRNDGPGARRPGERRDADS